MDSNQLFTLALQLGEEWKVVESRLDQENHRLELELDFKRGSKFSDPNSKAVCEVHDTVEKEWRHLNFFQYETILTARVPRIRTPEGKVVMIEAPWARAGSGFTLMMEAFMMLLCEQMPVASAGEIVGEHDKRLWRVVDHYVSQAQEQKSWKQVKRVMVDETSSRRGQRYVTNFVDAETKALLLMVEVRGAEAFGEFAKELKKRGGKGEQIELIVMDMSVAYQAGARKYFPEAEIVFDRFHLMLHAGKAVDEVRKQLQREGANLKGGLWAIRGNQWTRRAEQMELRRSYCKNHPKLGRAIGMRESLQEILKEGCKTMFKWWLGWADRSRLEPMRKLSRTFKEHIRGIYAFMETGLTNASMEAINGIIQLAKRTARGFRSFRYFRIAAYLRSAQLQFDLPRIITHSK